VGQRRSQPFVQHQRSWQSWCKAGAHDEARPTQRLNKHWADVLSSARLLNSEFAEGAGDTTEGPVQFQRVTDTDNDDNDLVLYIPGIDFTGVLLASLFEGLAEADFDVWRCYVTPSTAKRVPAMLLERGLRTWVERQIKGGRKVVLVGEGFGATLALSLGLSLGKALKGIVLFNPDRVPIDALSTRMSSVVSAAASSLGQQEMSKQRANEVKEKVEACFGSTASASTELDVTQRLRSWARHCEENLASELRLKPEQALLPPVLMLTPSVVDDQPQRMPVSPLGGSPDWKALATAVKPRCGEACLQQLNYLEEVRAPRARLATYGVRLGAAIRASPIYSKVAKRPDYIGDYTLPSMEELEESSAEVERAAAFWSPIFLSTSQEGSRAYGLENVPTPEDVQGRPVLLVGNHQLFGADLGPLIREFILEKGTVVRGLAMPFAFGNNQEMRGPGSLFLRFGAVPVGPRNIFRLLQRGEMALLFPGGVREAIHKGGEDYDLKWQESTDFVRVAARFDAIVVPFGGVGIDENFALLGNGDEVFQAFQDATRDMRRSGGDRPMSGGGLFPTSEALSQRPSFPLFIGPRLNPATADSPGFADRVYFSFGKPVDLQTVDAKDKDACAQAYQSLREAVQSEIDWLMAARKKDPYRDFLQRAIYEQTAALGAASQGRKIKGGPWKGQKLQSYGLRAPSRILDS